MNVTWEAEASAADAEWQAILGRTRVARADDARVWTTEIEELAAEHDQLIRDGRWVSGPEDLLSIIGRPRREAYHSAVLAWLLDPQGRHGLGASLLRALLNACGGDIGGDLRTTLCKQEVQRDDTRADVVVSGPGFTLLIENKVDAGEQDRQCDRLFQQFARDPGAQFLFLTPTGRKPTTATGAAADAFRSMSYAELTRLVRGAFTLAATTGATAHGREVVSNYLATLEKEFL
jgi:hypothetical protein